MFWFLDFFFGWVAPSPRRERWQDDDDDEEDDEDDEET